MGLWWGAHGKMYESITVNIPLGCRDGIANVELKGRARGHGWEVLSSNLVGWYMERRICQSWK